MSRFFCLFLVTCFFFQGHAVARERGRIGCPGIYDSWADSCFFTKDGETYVKRQHRKKIKYERDGFATVMTQSSNMVAINRQGRVVITDIAFTGDFDYPDAEVGVGRFAVKNDQQQRKCGYFQARNFQVVIPATYDFCLPFHGGQARVCIGCTVDCGSDPDCHVHEYVGGEGFTLNLRGEVLERRTLPTLPTCPLSPDPAKPIKPCRPNPNATLFPMH